MKLRNKKTGEVVIVIDHLFDNYNSLAELNEEWEDYEEPKQWYGLNAIRDVGFEPLEYEGFEDLYKHAKELGIAFETKEEAEKAVEKLKAWKRLKDARIRFKDYQYKLEDDDALITYKLEIEADGFAYEDFTDDLDLLFGGEE